ncbi:hypothetical protein [Deinococcus koreensis]|uniref:Yip1 domain-containing protein n=1 Tax=Deinococcus koreensis TaxID=2054903 RepID=A0A2K3V2P9_9DEIO|nr:hypothetical protein [Deinococcus koreensis]PNY83066.1 hypothetical protein CVO96_13810 [Deinococcus koreensis]
MARRPPVPPAPAAASAPLPTTLLSGPRVFAGQLQASEPRWWRYAAVVVLSSVLSGVAYALLVRHVPGSGPLSPLVNVLGGTFLGGLSFVLMWGLGHLGAGRAGRAAEVYGATFALLPPLWLLVIVWTLLTPAIAWLPQGNSGAGRALDQAALAQAAPAQAALRAAGGTQAGALLMLVTLLGTAAQFALAFPAFLRLTGQPGRALLGALLPLLPALLVQFVGIAPLVVALLSRPPGA